MTKNLIVFVSYTHYDDDYDKGALKHLARRLEGALRAFTGNRDLKVFFDRTSIDWGDVWRIRIGEALADSTILIPIVTPNYLSSEECRKEIREFLAQPDGRNRLLPIYYIEVTDLDTRDDAVSGAVRNHQSEDWRGLRTVGRASAKVQKAIEKLAQTIRDRLEAAKLPEQSNLPVVPSEASLEYRAQSMRTDSEEDDWIDYALIAQASFKNEEYGLARALLADTLKRFPDHRKELIHELAIVDWYDGAFETAVAEFEEALALHDGNERITVLQGLGQTRVEQGDFERGIEDLTVVIENMPDPLSVAYARSTRALGLGGTHHFNEALNELAAAEKVTPKNAWLHFNRARVLDWKGDTDRASASYIRSLVLGSPPLNRPKRRMAQRRLLDIGGEHDDAGDGL